MSLAERITTTASLDDFPRWSDFTAQGTWPPDAIDEGVSTTGEGVAIHYLVVPARPYRGESRFQRTADSFGLEWAMRISPDDPPIPTRGTVIYLHGWSGDKSMMLPWATSLASRGYRGVLPDLRHHGASDSAPQGFGPREARDILQLLPQWREQGIVEGPVYVMGVSYGAATAIFMASQSEARRDQNTPVAVIAVAPYANAAEAIERVIERKLASRTTPWFVRWRYPSERIPGAIEDASRILGVDLASIDVARAAASTPACLLLLHGAKDSLVPQDDSIRIARAASGSQFVPLPHENHMTAPMRFDWLATPIAEWLEAGPAGQGCPEFVLPPDPAD